MWDVYRGLWQQLQSVRSKLYGRTLKLESLSCDDDRTDPVKIILTHVDVNAVPFGGDRRVGHGMGFSFFSSLGNLAPRRCAGCRRRCCGAAVRGACPCRVVCSLLRWRKMGVLDSPAFYILVLVHVYNLYCNFIFFLFQNCAAKPHCHNNIQKQQQKHVTRHKTGQKNKTSSSNNT